MFVCVAVEAVSSQNSKWDTRTFLITEVPQSINNSLLSSVRLQGQPFILFMIHRPSGQISLSKDSQGNKTKISVLMNGENKFYNFIFRAFVHVYITSSL